MLIFLDANIIFSASKSAGAVRRLLAHAEAAGHRLCADAYVVAEAERNLLIKAPKSLPLFHALLRRLDVAAFSASTLPREAAALLPAKDQPVLDAAIRMRADALVTGDRRHFGALYGKRVAGVFIHSTLSLAEAIGLL